MTEPLTPPECDLRGMPFMPLDVVRLGDSDLAALATGDEFKAAVLLWCKSWTQAPAASLPNNDVVLARLAGLDAEHWAKVKHVSLRGFVLCSDGRLYHPVIAEKALEAWAERQRYRERREVDRKRLKDWREIKREKRASETPVKRVSKRARNAGETSKTGTETEYKISSLRSDILEPPTPKQTTKRVSPKVAIAIDLPMTDQARAFAAERGFVNGSVDEMWTHFTAYHAAKQTQTGSIEASWRTWVQNQVKFQGEQHGNRSGFAGAVGARNGGGSRPQPRSAASIILENQRADELELEPHASEHEHRTGQPASGIVPLRIGGSGS